MDHRWENLQIVVVECPYDTWNTQLTQEFFFKMVALKLAGFRSRHPYGVMPVDSYDFIASHQLICRKEPGGLRVLTGFKTVSQERCAQHCLPFPMLSILEHASTAAHKDYIDSAIKRCAKMGISLAYSGSWTVDPRLRADAELVQTLRSIIEAAYFFYYSEQGFGEAILGGVPRLKTDVLFETWGHKRIGANGQDLPDVSVPHLQDEKIAVMHLKEFSREVRERAEGWRALWENRIVSSPGLAEVIPLRKAA
jgi:hypothetical protein